MVIDGHVHFHGPEVYGALMADMKRTGADQFNVLIYEPQDAGPDAQYLRNLLLDEMRRAIAELPPEQREVFVAHELEGRSFEELALETGVNVNTLLSRKRYAVLHLRERLQNVHNEFLEK
jgi:RNA polymerase sigma factor (sigma-70 family)